MEKEAYSVGDTKWVGGSQYADGLGWYATGFHVQGIPNTPHRGEPEGSRDRKPGPPEVPTPVDHRHYELEEQGYGPGDKERPRLPTSSQERKGIPVYSGFVRYFPDAMAEVARLSKHGNDKHNPGQPLHWSRNKSTDHLDCVQRHTLEAGTVDDDGFLHDVKVAWRAMANLQVTLERVRGLPISPGSQE